MPTDLNNADIVAVLIVLGCVLCFAWGFSTGRQR